MIRTRMLILSLAFYSGAALPQNDEPGRDYARNFLQRYEQPQQVPPSALVPVVNALRDQRLADAIKHCNDLIYKDNSMFMSKPEANWIKSEAYRYLADATFRLNGNRHELIKLLKPAADLGNLNASKAITESMWRKIEGDPDYASVEATADELGTYLRIGAELGDAMSAVLLGANNSPAPIVKHEQTYWSMIGFALDINGDVEYRRHMMQSIVKRVGELEVSDSITKHSILPPRTPPGPGPLPGRGLVATIYADATLRREYGNSYGRRGTEGTPQKPTPGVLEIFKSLQAYANVVGDISAFLLVPESQQSEDRSILSISKDDLLSVLSPSDYVFVRCGSLAHVAVVHHIDRAAEKVYLVDGLWQFWQPSHNSCVTHFALVPNLHGGFLTELSLSDLSGMLEAAATLRDRLTENLSQKKQDAIPNNFRKLLREASMIFEQPQKYSPVPIRENKDMGYHFAIKSNTSDFEVRYHILPMPDDPKMKDYLNSENAHYSMVAATIANISKGGVILSSSRLTANDLSQFGADVGSITFLDVQHSEFGKDYKLCMTISLFAHNKGHAYIFLLLNADNAKEAQALIAPAYHSLRFSKGTAKLTSPER